MTGAACHNAALIALVVAICRSQKAFDVIVMVALSKNVVPEPAAFKVTVERGPGAVCKTTINYKNISLRSNNSRLATFDFGLKKALARFKVKGGELAQLFLKPPSLGPVRKAGRVRTLSSQTNLRHSAQTLSRSFAHQNVASKQSTQRREIERGFWQRGSVHRRKGSAGLGKSANFCPAVTKQRLKDSIEVLLDLISFNPLVTSERVALWRIKIVACSKGIIAMKPIRILHVCETAIGGVATYLNLLSTIPEDEVVQEFLVPSGHCCALDEKLSVVTYDSETRGLAELWRMIWAIRKRLRIFAPDIVFFHSTFALAGLVALRLISRRTHAIYCAHGWAVTRYDAGSLKGKMVRAVEGRLSGLADVVINVSHSDALLARQLEYGGRQVVVENAIADAGSDACNDLFFEEPNVIHLLFVGRLDRQKGLDILLEAFEAAQLERSDLRLHIVGAKVREDGGEIILPEGVTLVGWVEPSRIDDWYRSADALVVPSRWEGFGLVVPEALRNGTPVLVSDKGALPDFVEEGKNGHVFALDVSELEKLLKNLKKENLRVMRLACRDMYERKYAVGRWRDELKKVFGELEVSAN